MKEEELSKIRIDNFNEGRLHADKKWIEAINERIKELELQVGIPELRRVREKVKFRWTDEEDEDVRANARAIRKKTYKKKVKIR